MPDPATQQPEVGPPQGVLIVDRSDDSRVVLRTVLERRGVTIYEAPSARAGLEILHRRRPEVVVLDTEADAADDLGVRAAYDAQVAQAQVELVVLGQMRRKATDKGAHVLNKPYHYAALIETIERLVGQHTAAGN